MSTTVKFTKMITGEATDHVLWSFGDGTTSSSLDSAVFHDYAFAGDYTASLEGWSISGQYKKKTKIVTIPVSAVFFAIDSTNRVYRSTDPESKWILTSFDSTNHIELSIATGNDLVVVLCRNTSTLYSTIAISDDFGLTWTYYEFADYRYQYKIRFANGYFFCSPPTGLGTHVIARSVDGVNWTNSTNEYPYGVADVQYINETYTFLMGMFYGYTVVKYSIDLNTFSNVLPSELNNQWELIATPIQKLNNNLFVWAQSTSYLSNIYYSTDGSDFVPIKNYSGDFRVSFPFTSFFLTSANNESNIIVYVLSNNFTLDFYITKSTDAGTTFSDVIDLKTLIGESGTISYIQAIYYDGTNFIFQYFNGSVNVWTKSPDLITWTSFIPVVPLNMQVPYEIVQIEGSPAPIPLTANFSWVTNLGNSRQIDFTDVSTGAFTSVDTDFGDGSPHSSSLNPTHIYANYDTEYTVTYTISGADGSNHIEKVVRTGNPAGPKGFWKGENNTNDEIADHDIQWLGTPPHGYSSSGYDGSCFILKSDQFSYLNIDPSYYDWSDGFDLEFYVKIDFTQPLGEIVINSPFLKMDLGKWSGGPTFGAKITKTDIMFPYEQNYSSLTISQDFDWHKINLVNNSSGRADLYIDDKYCDIDNL